ncbi:MBL fold metallo-hydrolase [Aquincola sp. MAHUQ-54]|uniref:MBL fold metallo-hydrolase n=1 Tax=Aquincola agrisoli TaxID=3119538 RepID=A0AAW9QME8_9BURK
MYQVDVLVQGFPGKAVCHGGLGWSTVTLLRGGGRTVLVDVGAFGVRRELHKQLESRGVAPQDVTDVFLTHAHYDHAVNFVLFPNATVWIGAEELGWAAAQPPGFNPLPELYVAELARSPRVHRVRAGDSILPGLHVLAAPGHTPGHLLLYLDANPTPVLFTGDAAKNRAELLSREVDATGDAEASRRSIDDIWACWRRVPGTVLIPGHDLSMTLDEHGRPVYVGERKAAIAVWFSESIRMMDTIDLCGVHAFGAGYRDR